MKAVQIGSAAITEAVVVVVHYNALDNIVDCLPHTFSVLMHCVRQAVLLLVSKHVISQTKCSITILYSYFE